MTAWTKFAFGTNLVSCVWDISKTNLHNLTNFERSQDQIIMATFKFVEEMELLGYFTCF